MDSRAKQRLTGAVILVALFVLLVPELLTGPRSVDAPVGAPTEEGMRRYTIDLNASTPASQPETPSAQPAIALPPVVPNAVGSNPLDTGSARAVPGEVAAPAMVPAPETAAPPDKVPVTVSAKPAPRTPVTPSIPPVPRAQAPRSEAPRPTVVTSTERGNFVVQLGSFGSRDNAERLVRDMTAKGFAAFVAPITSGGRELYRVRVGPTRDRAAAEALAAQLQRIGQSGSIVPIT